MALKIETISLFKSTKIGAQGTAGTAISDPIDLREKSAVGSFSLSYTIASTNGTAGAGTAGSSTFEYLVAPLAEGPYVSPLSGTFGTNGASLKDDIVSFSAVVAPFMKIKAVTGTSNPLVLTANLHVR